MFLKIRYDLVCMFNWVVVFRKRLGVGFGVVIFLIVMMVLNNFSSLVVLSVVFMIGFGLDEVIVMGICFV